MRSKLPPFGTLHFNGFQVKECHVCLPSYSHPPEMETGSQSSLVKL